VEKSAVGIIAVFIIFFLSLHLSQPSLIGILGAINELGMVRGKEILEKRVEKVILNKEARSEG
jgi:hypothetical protein